MAETTTIALNLTFLMTLCIGFLLFLGHVLAFTTILVLVGGGRFIAMSFAAFRNHKRSFRGRPRPFPIQSGNSVSRNLDASKP